MRKGSSSFVLATALAALCAPQAVSAAIIPTDNPSTLAGAIAADPGSLSSPHGLDKTPLEAGFFANATADAPLAGFPTNGASFAILTSGDPALADDENTEGGSGRENGPAANLRGDTDYDVSVLKVAVNVPPGANCLAVDYRFLSEEFPEFVGSPFNDAFIAEVDTSSWTTAGSTLSAPNDFATDTSEEGVTVNGVGPVAVSPEESQGTTYDAATGLVTTKTPISSGAHNVFLSILDQSDQILDSAAFVDNMRFITEGADTCRPPFIAQAAPPPPPPPGQPAPPSNSFTLGSKVVFRNGSTVVTVNVPGPGTVTAGQSTAGASRADASAKKKKKAPVLVKAVRKNATKAGPVKLTIKPTKAGKKVLRRKRKLTVRMKFTYRPTGGTARSTFKKVTIKTKRRKRR